MLGLRTRLASTISDGSDGQSSVLRAGALGAGSLGVELLSAQGFGAWRFLAQPSETWGPTGWFPPPVTATAVEWAAPAVHDWDTERSQQYTYSFNKPPCTLRFSLRWAL